MMLVLQVQLKVFQQAASEAELMVVVLQLLLMLSVH